MTTTGSMSRSLKESSIRPMCAAYLSRQSLINPFEIAETQPEYIYESLEGTIVALRCPGFVEGINVPGWHLHFISKDRSKRRAYAECRPVKRQPEDGYDQ